MITEKQIQEVLIESYENEAYRFLGEDGLTFTNAKDGSFSYEVYVYEDKCEEYRLYPPSTDYNLYIDSNVIKTGINRLSELVKTTELYWPRLALGNIIMRDYDDESLSAVIELGLFPNKF